MVTQHISREAHEERNGHRGIVLWFTGLSGSGKTTISMGVERALFDKGLHVIVLDGDNMRSGLNSDLGFFDDDRHENIRRVANVARLFLDQGYLVLVSFISPFEEDREMARKIVGEKDFMLIYLDCPIEFCELRDAKGLYARVRRGKIKNFTGIDSPYEVPKAPSLVIKTGEALLEICVQKLVAQVMSISVTNKSI